VANNKIEPRPVPRQPRNTGSSSQGCTDKSLYAAVVIIPADFSKALMSLADPRLPPGTTTLSVYGNAGQSVAADRTQL